jgi:hypothetical protein
VTHAQFGQLEIDEDRGVLWFTPMLGDQKGRTTLRICGLPKGIDLNKPLQDIAIERKVITQQ